MLKEYEEKAILLLQQAESYGIINANIHCDLYTKLSSDNTDIVKTLTGEGSKEVYHSFMNSLAEDDKNIGMQIDFSPKIGTMCPNLTLTSVSGRDIQELDYSQKRFYCLIFWGSWSNTCKTHLGVISEIIDKNADEWADKIEFVSISLDETIDNIQPFLSLKTYWAPGFDSISDQGLHINNIPACLLIKDQKIIARRDILSSNFEIDIVNMLTDKELQIILDEGIYISSLRLTDDNGHTEILNLHSSFNVIVFCDDDRSESFIKQLKDTQNRHMNLAEKFKVMLLSTQPVDENCYRYHPRSINVVAKPGSIFVVDHGKILWKTDMKVENFIDKLRFWLDPEPELSKPGFYDSKLRIAKYIAEWKEIHPRAPYPNVLFTFSKRIYQSHSTLETHTVSLIGKYLQKYQPHLNNFFEYLLQVFPGAKDYSRYEAAHAEIHRGNVCSACNKQLEDSQLLSVVEENKYFCNECGTGYENPLYIIENESLELDEIRWGCHNLFILDTQDLGMHIGVVCDCLKFSEGCTNEIRGLRYKCAHCSDFDVCESCYTEIQHKHNDKLLAFLYTKGHEKWHTFIKTSKPIVT